MLTSKSEEKKPFKKYQKFRRRQQKDSKNPIDSLEIESENASWRESSKAHRNERPCSSNVIESKKKLNESVPPLQNSENLQKNQRVEKELTKSKVKLSLSISGNDFPVLPKPNTAAGVEEETNKIIKVNPSKAHMPATYRNPYKKKRTDPLLISFQDFLSNKKTRRKTRESSIQKTKTQRHKNEELLSGNFLDASNPKRSRGKHREIKKRKLSNLKLIIIKERIIKQKIREMGADPQVEWISLVDKIDFNTEVKAYLNELQNMKLKNSQKPKKNVTENLNNGKVKEGSEGVEKVVVKEEITVKEESFTEKKQEVENQKSVVHKIKEKKIPEVAREEIKFSSKFREYCDNFVTTELNTAVAELIKGLVNLQDRLFLRDPIKAKVKRRHVSGIREVKKYLVLKRVKMIIIAPNLEKLQMEGSVYDSIDELKSMANSQNVPYGFALDRYKLGKCTKKNVPVSAFGVLSYDGIEALYENALQLLMEAKRKFSEVAEANTVEKTEKDENSKVIATLISAFREGLQVSKEVELQRDEV